MNPARRQLLLAGAGIIAGCGGSSSSSLPPSQPRKDLFYGYYGGASLFVHEVAGHVNTFWPRDWLGPTEQIAGLTQAKGISNIVLPIPVTIARDRVESEARFWLQRLAKEQLLDRVRMVYVLDEPTHPRFGFSDAEVRSRTKTLRRVCAEFPQLAGVPLGMGFDGGASSRPGMTAADPAEAPDWIGLFHYHSRCGVVSELDALKRELMPHQRMIAYPFGASGEGAGDRLDPACILDYALFEPRVAMVAPFIWETVTDGRTYSGIRENGMADIYRAAGRRVIG